MVNEPDHARIHDDTLPSVESGESVADSRRESPLERLSPRGLRRLARRADRLRRMDVARFDDLAAAHGISARQLRLLADAWAESGRSGIEAIGPAVHLADWSLITRAQAVIETWRRRHFPLDALETTSWRNRITVHWLVPGEDRRGDLLRHPLMELRRTPDGRWHLYRMAVQGEWWPVMVRGRRRRQSLSACLDEVRVDSLHHFWGVSGPPSDLARGDAMPDSPLD